MPEALKVDREVVRALALQGLKPAQIAEKVGMKSSTVKTWLHRMGVSKTVSETKEILETGPRQDMALGIATDMAAKSKAAQAALSDVMMNQISVLQNDPVTRTGQLRNTPAGQGRAAVAKTVVEAASKVFGWDAQSARCIVDVHLLGTMKDDGLEKG